MRPGLRNALVFELGAGIYEFLTHQEVWRAHCRQMAAHVGGPRVLDLGIGPGVSGIEMAKEQPGSHYVGFDLSAAMLGRARKHVREAGVSLPLVRGDVARLPFADASFDAATAHSFFYLLPDAAAALAEVHRVVKPGGRVCFLEPGALGRRERVRAVGGSLLRGKRFGASMALWSVFSRLHLRWTEESFAAALERAGFDVTGVTRELGGLGLMASAARASHPQGDGSRL